MNSIFNKQASVSEMNRLLTGANAKPNSLGRGSACGSHPGSSPQCEHDSCSCLHKQQYHTSVEPKRGLGTMKQLVGLSWKQHVYHYQYSQSTSVAWKNMGMYNMYIHTWYKHVYKLQINSNICFISEHRYKYIYTEIYILAN